jgi:nucleoside-diphosphate-sugar epimerase
MSHVLVTGASGFIGRAVAAAFAKDGNQVRAAVRSMPRPAFGEGVEPIIHPDLMNPIDWPPLLAGIDVVIHLAAIAHSGGAAQAYDRVNRLATEQLAHAAAKAGIRRFVFVSSIRAQSGPSTEHILTERDAAQPSDPYGRSKLAAEGAVRLSGVAFTILRPVLLYGPGAKGNFAALLRVAKTSWPLPLRQFDNRRSLLGLDNFISALTFILGAPNTLGETYIVADPGRAPSLCEVVATLRQAQGLKPHLFAIPTGALSVPLRLLGRGELWRRIGGDLQVDCAKLLGAGWQPPHDTVTGLKALIQNAAQG